MKCEKCDVAIVPGDVRNHQDLTLCEDCYMVALSPMKTCDPWAVHSAKNFEKFAGERKQLTQIQMEMLQILGVQGAIQPETLQESIGYRIELADLQREFSTLRHMEKVKAEKQGDKILWRLW
jgi:hypothetical protein